MDSNCMIFSCGDYFVFSDKNPRYAVTMWFGQDDNIFSLRYVVNYQVPILKTYCNCCIVNST